MAHILADGHSARAAATVVRDDRCRRPSGRAPRRRSDLRPDRRAGHVRARPSRSWGTPELLERALFAGKPSAKALIAKLDGCPVSPCALPRHLLDLGVPVRHLARRPPRAAGSPPGRRGSGPVDRARSPTVERGCARLEWKALEWNTPALDFYAKIEATRLDDWIQHRPRLQRPSVGLLLEGVLHRDRAAVRDHGVRQLHQRARRSGANRRRHCDAATHLPDLTE